MTLLTSDRPIKREQISQGEKVVKQVEAKKEDVNRVCGDKS